MASALYDDEPLGTEDFADDDDEYWDEFDDYDDDDELGEAIRNCGKDRLGSCAEAGSEQCDECPFRDE